MERFLRITCVALSGLLAHPALAQSAPEVPPAVPAPPVVTAPPVETSASATPPNPDLFLPPVRSKEDAGFSPGDTPTGAIEELDEMYAPRTGTVDVPVVEGPLDALTRALNDLYAKTGLRVGVAYTMLFQQSIGPGSTNGFSGDLDIMTAWTLLGRGTRDTGTFVFTGEDRFRLSTQPPSAIGGEIGTLTNTTGGFNARGWVVRDAYWLQRLFDDHFRFLIGRADPSDFVGGHRMQSINNSFLNRAFSANASVAFPSGHVPTAGFSVLPNDFFYFTGGVANGYGTSSTINVSSLDQGDFFWFGEAGITPQIKGLGSGRYRVMLWRMDERPELALPEDQGISVILEQDIGARLMAFTRYSYSDADLTNIQNAVQGGVGYRGLLGSADNLTGLAGSYAEPPGGGRDEKVFELFHRWQLTRHTQFTLGAQLIIDPTNNPSVDALGVFEARLRIAF